MTTAAPELAGTGQAGISAAAGPLSGLKVLEISHFVAAPFCARLLADLGADVIKVEPRDGDPVRTWGKAKDGHAIWWSVHGRNKRSLTLDLKSEEGRDIALRLAEKSDVLIENFRPGQLARLGLSDELLRQRNPRLVIAHISGFGQDGPDRDRSGFGAIGEAIGGLRYLTNHPAELTDLPPTRVGISIGDSIAGLYAAFGVVAALWQRDRDGGSGRGQPVDVALTEAILSMMEGVVAEYGVLGEVRAPSGSRIPTTAPSNAYPSRDGNWVIIAANSQPLFARLSGLMGRPDLPNDDRFRDNPARVANVEALDALIEQWTRTKTAAELDAALASQNIPACRIYNAADIAADPQFRARRMVREVADPMLGPVLHPGIVPHMPDAEGAVRWTGPEIGAHSAEILARVLDMSAADIAELREKQVI